MTLREVVGMTTANLFGVLEGPELLILLLIVLLLFGGTKLPQLAKSLGEAKREFHDGTATTAVDAPKAEIDTVTISRAELDRLRRADRQPPSGADSGLSQD